MSDDGREALMAELVASRDAFLAAVQGVAGDAASRRAGEGQWTILECAEHVALAERAMLDSLTAAEPGERMPAFERREARITAAVVDRARRVSAPESTVPAGRFAALGDASRAFADARGATLAFLAAVDGDLRALRTIHPVFGPMSSHELAVVMAGHSRRHAAQVEEIRAGLDRSRDPSSGT
jgi:hypothetical protein